MARFGFGQNFGGFGSMAELTAYPAVGYFQTLFNSMWDASRDYVADQRISGSKIGVDSKYGSSTQNALERFTTFLVRRAICAGTSATEARSSGPYAVRHCLMAAGLNAAQVDQMQQAWREWKAGSRSTTPDGGGGSVDPYAGARMECATSGGTWNTATNTCTPAAAASEGLSAGAWIAIALLGALGAYGAYYVATEGK